MNNFNEIQVAGNTVIKSFKDKDRFHSELENNQIFRDMGYHTTEIIAYDIGRLEITFKAIRGESILNSEFAISKTIDTIASIVRDTLIIRNYCEIRDYYCELVLQSFALLDSRLLKNINLLNFIELLRKKFRISVFKDCKPDNFIYSSGEIYLIDFDYVRESFFLADLAQFFSYYILENPDNITYWTAKFMRSFDWIDMDKLYEYILLIYLSIINSNMLTISRNRNISASMVKQKEQISYSILKNYLYL